MGVNCNGSVQSSMRTLLLLLCIVALTAIGLGYTYVYKPYVAPLHEVASTWSELNQDVENQSAFEPPEDTLLTERQIARYRAVQEEVRREVRNAMGDTWSEVEQSARRIGSDGEWGVRDLGAVVAKVRDGLVRAKQSQVAALNRQQFSIEEYAWVQRQMYRSMGVELPEGGLRSLAGEALWHSSGDRRLMLDENGVVTGDVPKQNIQRVQRHADWLAEHIDLALVGL